MTLTLEHEVDELVALMIARHAKTAASGGTPEAMDRMMRVARKLARRLRCDVDTVVAEAADYYRMREVV